ncbi:MAG TPA: phosphoribosylformylglycinamidine cyclo-ligase [Candidatus Sulfotelmatobacter sp.]|nr:phosphoribosylformylglycinamidine cyclo-ligase [Candidatus Sulfotelmatobacter sp.]
MPRSRMTYARAGVDVSQVRKSHEALARRLESTFNTRRGKVGHPVFPIGHYAGLVDLNDGRVLSLHTDSVGTKVIIAQLMRKYDTIGIDCVAMCANDLICTGTEPISFLDYLAMAKHDRRVVEEIAIGLVEGARQAGMAIVGGETAIVPDLLSKDAGLDLVGMAVGIGKEKDLVLGDETRNGDALVGVASSGIHSNGLTIARKILLEEYKLKENVTDLGRSVGQELLEPTRIYVKPVLEATRKLEVHGLAHITGGAFAKLDRIVGQAKLGANIAQLPPTPGIFRIIQKRGRISDREMYRTFNMGVGFILICPQRTEDAVIRLFVRHGHNAFDIGRVEKERGIRVKNKVVG